MAAIITPRRETVYLAHARITLDEAGWPVWIWAGDYVQHPDYQSALDAARGGTVCLHVLELIPVDGARIMPELAQHVRAALGTVPR